MSNYIRPTIEEGHYTIKRVPKLPKRGNANWLYAIISDHIKEVYRWDAFKKEYETITLGATSYLELTDIPEEVIITKTSEITNDGADGDSYYIEYKDLSKVATTNNYNDLDNTPDIPTKTSDLTNDGANGSSEYVEKDELAKVATTNSYNDLDDKPEIPEAITNTSQLTNDGADGQDAFATVSQVNGRSLQDVIDVDKQADRVLFRKIMFTPRIANGSIVSYSIDTLDSNKTYLYITATDYDGMPSGAIKRINEDGSLDTEFNIGTGIGNAAYSGCKILVDPAGKVYVSGIFTNFNGTPANRIISINPNGTINTAFNYGSGFDRLTLGMAFNVAKTHIYICGIFNSYKGVNKQMLVKVDLNGNIDETFDIGSGFDNTTIDVLVDEDDTLTVTGYFSSYKGVSANRIVRINPDGSRIVGFQSGTGFNTGSDQPNFVFRNSEDVLIAYGYFTAYNGTPANRIIALNNNGTVNTNYNFGSGFNNIIQRIEQTSDGKYHVSGQATDYNGTPYLQTIMLNSDFSVYSKYLSTYITETFFTSTRKLGLTWDGTNQSVSNLSDRWVFNNSDLAFSEITGEATYSTGGLDIIDEEEIMPRRLIELLIDKKVPNAITKTSDIINDGANSTSEYIERTELEEELSSITNPDRLTKTGRIDTSNGYARIEANAFNWILDNVEVTNTPGYSSLQIPSSTDGTYRRDYISGDAAGNYNYVSGVESTTYPEPPTVGENLILIGEIIVFGDSITGYVNQEGNVKKTEYEEYLNDQSGSDVFIRLPSDGRKHIVLTNAALESVVGLDISEIYDGTPDQNPYQGKEFKFLNETGDDLLIKHASTFTTRQMPFILKGGVDTIIPNNEILTCRFNNGAIVEMNEEHKSWIDEISIQNENGEEQFKTRTSLMFENMNINPTTKIIKAPEPTRNTFIGGMGSVITTINDLRGFMLKNSEAEYFTEEEFATVVYNFRVVEDEVQCTVMKDYYIGDYRTTTLTHYIDNDGKAVGTRGLYSFRNNPNITKLILPKIKTIGDFMLEGVINLSEYNFDSVEYLGGGYNLLGSQLVEINFPRLKRFWSFEGNSNLSETAYFPLVTEIIGQDTFKETPIKTLEAPNCEKFTSSTFRGSSVVTIKAPKIKRLGEECFIRTNPGEPRYLDFPVCEEVGNRCFYEAQNIRLINIPNCKQIGDPGTEYQYVFYGIDTTNGLVINVHYSLKTSDGGNPNPHLLVAISRGATVNYINDQPQKFEDEIIPITELYDNDTTAAAAGVKLGQRYVTTSGDLKVRLT